MMFGPGAFGGGQTSVQQNAAAGLPYANVPGHLSDLVDDILASEPDHPTPMVEYSPAHYDRRPFGLRTFLRPHAGRLTIATLVVAVEAALLNVGPLLVRVGIDEGIGNRDTSILVRSALFYLGAVALAAIASLARISYTGRLGERLMYELRIRVFSHFQRQSLSFFTSEKAGVLMTRMTSDIEALTQLFQEGLVQFAVQGLTVVAITVFLFSLNSTLALITIGLAAPVTIASGLIFRKISAIGYGRVRNAIADVLSDLSESLAGIRIIAANNRRVQNLVHHRNVIGRHRDANLFATRAQAVFGSFSEAVSVAVQALLLLWGGRMVQRGELTVGELTAFLLFLNRFFAPIQTLIQLFNQYQSGSAAIEKLRHLLQFEPQVVEAPTATVLPPIDGAISFVDVRFGYDDDTEVLHGINLEVEPGEVLSIVGPTGAGKSTVAKLVTRFYDPTDGTISIDGTDLRDVTLHSLRSQLGVVPQEAFLFNGTIRDNVAFGRPDASDEDIWHACVAVGIDDIVEKLPGGLDAPIHERGSSLSAGERQLLALARAFLARPRVLILDEATSNLDLLSETKIERALDAVLEGRSAIIIAHRLATAMRADRIAVIDEGNVLEIGTHEELVALGGQYAEMHETWSSHVDVS